MQQHFKLCTSAVGSIVFRPVLTSFTRDRSSPVSVLPVTLTPRGCVVWSLVGALLMYQGYTLYLVTYWRMCFGQKVEPRTMCLLRAQGGNPSPHRGRKLGGCVQSARGIDVATPVGLRAAREPDSPRGCTGREAED